VAAEHKQSRPLTQEGLTKWTLPPDYGCQFTMSSQIKKKKLDYPDGTEGSRLAARIRQRANKMTSSQREESLKRAMQIYYGGQPKEAARS
jgi:hypothetical protein